MSFEMTAEDDLVLFLKKILKKIKKCDQIDSPICFLGLADFSCEKTMQNIFIQNAKIYFFLENSKRLHFLFLFIWTSRNRFRTCHNFFARIRLVFSTNSHFNFYPKSYLETLNWLTKTAERFLTKFQKKVSFGILPEVIVFYKYSSCHVDISSQLWKYRSKCFAESPNEAIESLFCLQKGFSQCFPQYK